MRKAELLLASDLGDMVLSKAWNDLLKEHSDLTLLVYTALQVEAHCPGTIPQELLVSLSSKVSASSLTVHSLPRLEGEAIEYLEEVEELLDQSDDLTRLAAYAEVKALLRGESINPKSIRAARKRIQQNIDCFRALINPKQKGGVAA